ncbi:hypothetical protein PRUPE_3G231500 [Prunus persica]|uniref:Uncharacterized protein n=1 Tax=Prunus persica TaxID=3760 RepID=A0A251Q7L9_PRUPE|nr:hypothetical protein PRUPE_3G231500 [Prunus persica]
MTKFTALCQFCFRKFVIERAVSYSEPSVYKFDFFCVFYNDLKFVFMWPMMIQSACLRCGGAETLFSGRTPRRSHISYDINGFS